MRFEVELYDGLALGVKVGLIGSISLEVLPL
jgi:hypothetical protein